MKAWYLSEYWSPFLAWRPEQRWLVLIVVICGFGIVSGYFFIYPHYLALEQIKQEYKQVNTSFYVHQQRLNGLPTLAILQERVAQIENQLIQRKPRLKRDEIAFLIGEAAEVSMGRLTMFSSITQRKIDPLSSQSWHVHLRGNYMQFMHFVNQIGRYSDFLVISDMTLEGDESGLVLMMTLTWFDSVVLSNAGD